MFSFSANRPNQEKKIDLAALTGLSVTNETYEYTHDHLNHFIRRPVGEEGDDVYALFGMSRRETASLMTRNLASIKETIKPAVKAALETDEFVNYLVFHDIIPKARPDETLPVQPKKGKQRRGSSAEQIVNDPVIREHINHTQDLQEQEQKVRQYVNDDALLETLVTPVASLVAEVPIKRTLTDQEKERLPEFDEVNIAYIRFDVSMGEVNHGASPICVLRAVAKLDRKTLSITSVNGENNVSENPSILVDNFIELTDYKEDDDEEHRVLFTEDPSESEDEPISKSKVEESDHLVSSFGAQGEEIFLDQSSQKQLRRMKPGAQRNEYTVCPLPTLDDKAFLAFGATREEVYQLLSENLWRQSKSDEASLILNEHSIVKKIVKHALRLAVIKQDFYEYLVSDALPKQLKDKIAKTNVSDYLESGLHQDICDGLRKLYLINRKILDVLKDHVNPNGEAPAAGKRFFDALSSDPYLIHAYLHFDLMQKSVEQGWSHPLVLLAYATMKGIKLNMWKRNTWSNNPEDYMNIAPVYVHVPRSIYSEPSASLSERKARDTYDFYDWLSKTQIKTKRDMHIFFTEGNQFERLEILSKHEHVSEETLKVLHQEKVKRKEKSDELVMGRFNYKMTPLDDFEPLAVEIYGRKGRELQSFYEKTAKEATQNNLWSVLRYLIKDSDLRKKLEIRQLKELQDIEKTAQVLADKVGIRHRVLNLMEYMSAASELRGQPFPQWSETDDAEKLSILQNVLDKIFDEYKKTLILEYTRSANDKREQDFITDDLQVVPKTTAQKIAEYGAMVEGYQPPCTAVELLTKEGGIRRGIDALSENLDDLEEEGSVNEAAHKSFSALVGLRDSSMLGRCINDRINIGTFLEGKDEYANKYRIDLIEIIGQENIRRFQEMRSSLGLSEGDFLYEFFGKYPPSVSPDTVYEYGNNLLHIALQNDNPDASPWKNLPMVRGLLTLGVDPAMKNDHGTRPVDVVVQLYRDDELGNLMLTRISLDNQLISGVANQRWLEKESSFIAAFHAYTKLVEAPKPDAQDPKKAQQDKTKMTVYTPDPWLNTVPDPGVFSTGQVEYLISFDQKINYIMSHFKQLVSIDKVCFINPFYSAGEEIVRLNGMRGSTGSTAISDEQIAGKIAALKRRRIELSRLRSLFFVTLATVSIRSHMNYLKEALDLTAGRSKLAQSELTRDENISLKNAVVSFDETRGIIKIYQDIAQVALARHSVRSDLPLVEYIEAMMKNPDVHPFTIQNYHNIILQLHEVATRYRREPGQFGRMHNVKALNQFQRELQPLLTEHDRLRGVAGNNQGGGSEGGNGQGSSAVANELRRVEVPEDNNSFFMAVELQLRHIRFGGIVTASEIKAQVIDHMNANRRMYFLGPIRDDAALTNHLQGITEGTIAAGKPEIWALVRLFSLHIHVRQSDGQVHEYGHTESPHKIHLELTADGYYMSLLPNAAPINQMATHTVSTSASPAQPAPTNTAATQPSSPNVTSTLFTPLSPGLSNRGSGSRSPGVYFTQPNRGNGPAGSSRQGSELRY